METKKVIYGGDGCHWYKHEDMQKSRMSKEEMSEYIDFIDKWSIENFGYPIPDAGKEQ